MSTLVSIEDAKRKLSELIDSLGPEDQVVITRNNRPIAQLTPTIKKPRHQTRQPGTLRGTVKFMSAEFDAPLAVFMACME